MPTNNKIYILKDNEIIGEIPKLNISIQQVPLSQVFPDGTGSIDLGYQVHITGSFQTISINSVFSLRLWSDLYPNEYYKIQVNSFYIIDGVKIMHKSPEKVEFIANTFTMIEEESTCEFNIDGSVIDDSNI